MKAFLTKPFLKVPVYGWLIGAGALVVGLFVFNKAHSSQGALPITASDAVGTTGTSAPAMPYPSGGSSGGTVGSVAPSNYDPSRGMGPQGIPSIVPGTVVPPPANHSPGGPMGWLYGGPPLTNKPCPPGMYGPGQPYCTANAQSAGVVPQQAQSTPSQVVAPNISGIGRMAVPQSV
jgi:hypothetical protein